MSELKAFLGLGFHHITDPSGLDHVLFLLALAAIYRPRDWRSGIGVVTAFTVGHSISLALAVTGALVLPSELIEFLIPLTIVATGVENLMVSDMGRAPLGRRYRSGFAAVFGLIHGAGFANYLRSLFSGSIAVPLLGFNLGIEVGQVAILGVAGVTLAGVDRLVGHRPRVLWVSAAVVLIALNMAAERVPW